MGRKKLAPMTDKNHKLGETTVSGNGTKDNASACCALNDALKEKLLSVTTATITSQLQIAGYQNCFMNGIKPLHSDQKMVGIAHTLRYLPYRPDIWEKNGRDVQRCAVESMKSGEVMIIDARSEPDAGTTGDLYCMRMKVLGGAGVVTDGALRDTPMIESIEWPVYYRTSHGSTLGRRHSAIDEQIPVCCAGVTVYPGDIVFGDSEGVVVIPAEIAEEIVSASIVMELEETFALEKISVGGSTEDYFPLGEAQRIEYQEWLSRRSEAN